MKKLVLAALLASFTFGASAAEKINFGVSATYPPFESIGANNEIVGFDIDLAKALCKQMQAECTFTNHAFDSLIPSLKFRKYDAVISGMDITPERSKQVSFTTPYYENSAVVIAKKDTYKTFADLKGKRIGMENDTTHQKYIQDQHPEVKTVSYDSYQNAFIDLKNGRIDGVFGDTAVVNEWLKTNPQLGVATEKVTDPQYFGTGLGIAVRPDNKALLEKLKVITVNIQPVHMAIMEGETEIYLTEQQALAERFNDVPLWIRPQSFFQTNPAVASQLYATARDWVRQLPVKHMWDLFCGVGGFGLHCATPDMQLTGIEIAPEAIACAKQSAAELGLTRLQFQALDSTQFATAQGEVPELVLVNPPRRGIGKPLCDYLSALVTILRGLPEILVVLFIYFGSSQLLLTLSDGFTINLGFVQIPVQMDIENFDVSPFLCGVIALSLLYAAYASQTLRGALKAVPVGQWESGQALGLSKSAIFFRLVMPQMWRHALPGLGNQWLVLLKDTALVSLISVNDLMLQTKSIATRTQEPFTWYIVAAAIYLVYLPC